MVALIFAEKPTTPTGIRRSSWTYSTKRRDPKISPPLNHAVGKQEATRKRVMEGTFSKERLVVFGEVEAQPKLQKKVDAKIPEFEGMAANGRAVRDALSDKPAKVKLRTELPVGMPLYRGYPQAEATPRVFAPIDQMPGLKYLAA